MCMYVYLQSFLILKLDGVCEQLQSRPPFCLYTLNKIGTAPGPSWGRLERDKSLSAAGFQNDFINPTYTFMQLL